MEGNSGECETAIARTLRRRGFLIHSMNPWEMVLAPQGNDEAGTAGREAFYQSMRRYSFRILLRDIIARREGFTAEEVQRYATLDVTMRDLETLCGWGVIEREGERYALVNRKAASFGETLEWYVASVLEREYDYRAAWSVKLSEESGGGDYDVLAAAEGRLLYVETKASPPKNIHQPQIRGFLDRTRRLGPEMAIFLIDTELRLEDKILPMFREALPELREELEGAPLTQPRAIYDTGRGLCIANSRRDLVENLRLCLRAMFRGNWRV